MNRTALVLFAPLTLAVSPAYALDGSAGQDQPSTSAKKTPKADIDKDGAISKSEWLARSEKRFGETDKNADGKVTREEMKANREKRREKWKENKAKREQRREERKEKHEKPSLKPEMESMDGE